MRSTDERVNEVLGRARAQEVANRCRRQRIAALGGGALSIVVVAALGVGMSSLPGAEASPAGATLGLMGSVFAGGSTLGYVVIGLLGFALGAAVTVLAYRLGRPRDGRMLRAEDGNSVPIPSERASNRSKDPHTIIPLESMDTITPDRPDSDRSAKTEPASDAESVKP